MLNSDAKYQYFTFILIKSVQTCSFQMSLPTRHPRRMLPKLKRELAELHWDVLFLSGRPPVIGGLPLLEPFVKNL